jgi:hypothetical protein
MREFTGDKWLDGFIFAFGSPKNKECVIIDVSNTPIPVIGKIERKLIELGYDVDMREVFNQLTKQYNLKVYGYGVEPVFKKMQRYSDRRLTYDEDIEYLNGFFTAISEVAYYKRKERYGIRISYPMPFDDIAYVLKEKYGIEDSVYPYHQGIFIPMDSVKDIEPFKTIIKITNEEDKYFEQTIGTKEKAFDDLFNRIKEQEFLHG